MAKAKEPVVRMAPTELHVSPRLPRRGTQPSPVPEATLTSVCALVDPELSSPPVRLPTVLVRTHVGLQTLGLLGEWVDHCLEALILGKDLLSDERGARQDCESWVCHGHKLMAPAGGQAAAEGHHLVSSEPVTIPGA